MTTTNQIFEQQLSQLVWHWMPEVQEDDFDHINNIWPQLRAALSDQPKEALDNIEAMLDEDNTWDAFQELHSLIKTLPVERLMTIIGDEPEAIAESYVGGLTQYFVDLFSDYDPSTVDHAGIAAVVQRIQGA